MHGTRLRQGGVRLFTGLYLGDGHIISKRKQHHLSVYCNAKQTGLIAATEDAMRR